MAKIFWGFLLIFLDFNLNLGSSQIGLIPDFAGYLVLIGGLTEMAEESPLFAKVKPYAAGMAVYTGILYVMDLMGISASLGALSYLFAIVSIAVSLYISYHIVLGVKEMEETYRAFLGGDALKSAWKLLALFQIATYVLLLFPAAAVICIIVVFIMAIRFLIAFSKSKSLYHNLNVGQMKLNEESEE